MIVCFQIKLWARSSVEPYQGGCGELWCWTSTSAPR